MGRVLPHVPYRQWRLPFPDRVQWVLLKDAGLLSDALTLFLHACSPTSADGLKTYTVTWGAQDAEQLATTQPDELQPD